MKTIRNPFHRNISFRLFSVLFACVGLLLFALSCGPEGQSGDARQAASADTLSAQQHFQAGLQSLYQKWDYAAARTHFERAIELDPDFAPAHAHYAWYLELEGRFPEAVEHAKRARDLQPDNAVFQGWAGWICFDAGDLACAETELLRALEMNPGLPGPRMIMGNLEARRGNKEAAADWFMQLGKDSAQLIQQAHAYALRGEEAEALAVVEEVLARESPEQYINIATVYAHLGEREAALDMLERAYESHHEYMPFLPLITWFEPLHEDPRFVAIMDKVGRAS